jgi:hypothetical protein
MGRAGKRRRRLRGKKPFRKTKKKKLRSATGRKRIEIGGVKIHAN